MQMTKADLTIRYAICIVRQRRYGGARDWTS